MADSLKISVVGHTNTGKTSLLRTLTRDARFGEVSGRPGTTRHVEVARLNVQGQTLLELYDTPGIEDAIDLLDLLDQQSAQVEQRVAAREDGPTRIERFLQSAPAAERFEQEAKVLRQMLRSHAALYVIDARDPVLSKHRDELEILNMCGVPLLPLLNFVAGQKTNETEWREMLAGLGLHAIVRFDTVAPARDGEKTLYTKLASLLDAHGATLQRLIRSHESDAQQRHTAALDLIATLLVETAALKLRISRDEQSLQRGIERLNKTVREHEQSCVAQLLSLHRFYPDDIDADGLPLVDGRWEQDLFDPYTLQNMGIQLGSGAAAGAAAGLGIDLMVGGMTLGAAAATGALLGGGFQTLRHYGSDLMARVTGEKTLRVDDSILNALATRQVDLLAALERRGHAAQQKLALARLSDMGGGSREPLFVRNELPESLRRARSQSAWARDSDAVMGNSGKHQAVQQLSKNLQELMASRYRDEPDQR
ncbi:MAG TPA: DUF3482 domain-containing protein [Pseudohongiella sp.]|nr:GTPase SAR1 [Pseudohongiella sp.]HBX36787.1 DUF3482 domain-containing protein [Pseudohongiella sp.]|tara:strand:+ start:4001 stop:5443 length:1443 start_codon:yes stop_codon:yes gene_type:complete